ncbi:Opi1-domain-containing protein [Tilletiaria anomala UBC 951]|uniref:Opi1-domain-containing protein n=1 Tax=Tilletiaria anomala (strain ATCC 24038 / CBS 436.72 / UBC 951) TaxID=1037660 RepID=A0A066WEE3_TILAU|nr:Opi1-domain-containing protein [Tilletiaria anomala UBC 951]KDN52312.1 Opi1-domain-containing protein [Tilletiaria anomala UBC 951]
MRPNALGAGFTTMSAQGDPGPRSSSRLAHAAVDSGATPPAADDGQLHPHSQADRWHQSREQPPLLDAPTPGGALEDPDTPADASSSLAATATAADPYCASPQQRSTRQASYDLPATGVSRRASSTGDSCERTDSLKAAGDRTGTGIGIGRQMGQLSINEEDKDVQIAIAALGSMRQSHSHSDNQRQSHKKRAVGEDEGLPDSSSSSSSVHDRPQFHHSAPVYYDAPSNVAGPSRHAALLSDTPASVPSSSLRSEVLSERTAPRSSRHASPPSIDSSSGGTTLEAMSSVRGGRGGSRARSGHDSGGGGTGTGSESAHPTTAFTIDSYARGGAGGKHSTTDSQAGSDSNSTTTTRSSTASAIVHDDDGNPVRIELDSDVLAHVDGDDADDDAFLQRVGKLPIVRGTLRAYELGKQKSRVVKYGADLVESSVKSISRPVISRVGGALGEQGVQQLDNFASRQLERIYPALHSNPSTAALGRFSPTKEEKAEMLAEVEERERTEWQHMDDEEKTKRRKAYWALKLEEKEREMVVQKLREQQSRIAISSSASPGASAGIGVPIRIGLTARDGPGSSAEALQQIHAERLAAGKRLEDLPAEDIVRVTSDQHGPSPSPSPSCSSSLVSATEMKRKLFNEHSELHPNQAPHLSSSLIATAAPQQRSGWSGMLAEAGVTAGGLSAAMSEESLKSLKYCLQWLQYATAHMEHQITQLRDLIVKLNHGELDMTVHAGQHLGHIKGDVVNTIRGVVDVVGKYAGAALPGAARNKVREFMLSLPARWATVNRTHSFAPGSASAGSFGGSPASPSFSPEHATAGRSGSTADADSGRSSTNGSATGSSAPSAGRNPQAAHTAMAANKVLTLAVESLDILRSVTVVFGESLDRADLWMGRLRYLGLQRKRQHEAAVGRIEVSVVGDWERGGAVHSRPHEYEHSGGSGASARASSPGAYSDVSMASGSSKRRKRSRRTQAREREHQYQQHPHRHHSHHHQSRKPDSASEDGNLTETERATEYSADLPMPIYNSTTAANTPAPAFAPGTGSSSAYSHGPAPASSSAAVHWRKNNRSATAAAAGKAAGSGAGGARSRPPSTPGTPNLSNSASLHPH